MKKTVVFMSCIFISLASVNPVHSYSNRSFSNADAVATALAAYNRADVAYNSASVVYSAANGAYNTAKAAFEGAKATYDAAIVEYNSAALALNAAILAVNAADNYVNNQCRQLGCSDSAYAAAVADWQAKYSAYLAALARRDASIVGANTSRDAYNATVGIYNAAQSANNNAATILNNASAVKTAAYNLYIEAQATAAKNNNLNTSSSKNTVPKNIAATTVINAPVLSVGGKGLILPVKKYRNCTELRKAFPKGVAKNAKSAGNTGAKINAKVYALNIGSDRDKDGIACELA